MRQLIKNMSNHTQAISIIGNLVIPLFAFLFSNELLSQTLNDNKSFERNFREEIFVRTDRDTYITGEKVWLKVYKLNGLMQVPFNLSKVVYLELLDKNNFPVKQLKISADNTSGAANFKIPDNLSSGNYLIRAYTSWMKNFSSDQFYYRTISVINPFESIDHIKLPSNSSSSASPGKDYELNAEIIDDQGRRMDNIPGQTRNNGRITFKIDVNSNDFKARDKVHIGISATDQNGKPVDADISVSVVKSFLSENTRSSGFHCFTDNTGTIPGSDSSGNVAELEGQLIGGFLRLKSTNEPLKNTDISLSFVGKTARCQFGKTNTNGEFNFLVKETGVNEIVIQPLSPEITGYYVELKQPYSGSFSKWKPSDLYLDSTRINDINKAVISAQVNNIYDPFMQDKPAATPEMQADFFGKAESTIRLADYIELTTLHEVVKELLPYVYTQKQNGKYDFKLINKFRGQPFENKPLILLDGVPFYDFEKILNINSRDIEKAEIMNTRYFFSDYIFDGIVSFTTKKGNLSVLDYDKSVFRQAYEGCQPPVQFYSPDYTDQSRKNDRLPDFRNTLYWNPGIHTGVTGNTSCDFFTSDEAAQYTIIVEGITPDGKTGSTSQVIRVN